MTQTEVVSEVRGQLLQGPLQEFGLDVFESGIRQDGEWWYVPITPKNSLVSSFDYASKLHKVEEFFEKSLHTKLLLIPASGVGE